MLQFCVRKTFNSCNLIHTCAGAVVVFFFRGLLWHTSSECRDVLTVTRRFKHTKHAKWGYLTACLASLLLLVVDALIIVLVVYFLVQIECVKEEESFIYSLSLFLYVCGVMRARSG